MGFVLRLLFLLHGFLIGPVVFTVYFTLCSFHSIVGGRSLIWGALFTICLFVLKLFIYFYLFSKVETKELCVEASNQLALNNCLKLS